MCGIRWGSYSRRTQRSSPSTQRKQVRRPPALACAACSDPAACSKLRILDPACGSGSFLLGAYQYLLDWHRDWYVRDGAEKHAKEIYAGPGGVWRLTTAEKKRILKANIYGVDIDPQAVEVTKLSLLLKVLEGESKQTLERHLYAGFERALPDLANNIKCGNSLIGPDFYDGQDRSLFDDEEKYRINVFDWNANFPKIMKAGGFDVVIGNPPYVRIQRISEEEARYIYRRFEGPTSKVDLSLVFLERGLQLTRSGGFAGFICTSQWLSTNYGANMRRMLRDGRLLEIVDFGSLPVFQSASTYPANFILSPTRAVMLKHKRINSPGQLNLTDIEAVESTDFPVERLPDGPWNFSTVNLVELLRARNVPIAPLSTFGKAYIGTKSGMIAAFVVSLADAKKLKLERKLLLPYAMRGGDIERYSVTKPGCLIIYPYREGQDGTPELLAESELRSGFPNVHKHLSAYKDDLRRREDSRRLYATGADWYRHLRAGSYYHIHAQKLVLRGIAKTCRVGLLQPNTAFDGARCPAIIIEDAKSHELNYFLGLMNSRLVSYVLKGLCPPKLSGYVEFSAKGVSQAPIRVIDFSSPADKSRHDRMVALVEQMLELHLLAQRARTPSDQAALQAQIDATDRQIDALVYELYGLTEEEIRIVEAGK